MPGVTKVELSGWGRYPRSVARVFSPETIAEALPPHEEWMIARGLGRSYGDAAMLTKGLVILTERLNQQGSFDEQAGLLTAEGGMALSEVLRAFVSRGWFPAVVPGTKFVSLGGCVAADIHGKNHHRDGTFGTHVRELEIALADGTRRRCSPENDADLFWATTGAMGLTGIITKVTFELLRIESPYVVAQHHQAKDLDASLEMFESQLWDDHYTVAWLDCLALRRNLGRGILIRGHHAQQDELPVKLRGHWQTASSAQRILTFDFPSWILNAYTVRLFNELYYRSQGMRTKPFICDYESFFFPLDRIANWNRMYGKRGFIQYQCVLPLTESRRGLQTLLQEVAKSHRSSFLAVLKRFGAEGNGILSFPMAGYTLALDFPVSDPGLFPFLERLDEIVLTRGGRVYLAKDARLRAENFRNMYPRLAEWQRIKSRIDSDNHFMSDLGCRLGMRSSNGLR
jgi:decaprenylphospho-beta-D-ribofuranose 2-oxidase